MLNNYSMQLTLGFEQLYSNNKSVKFYTSLFSELDLSSIEEYPRKNHSAGNKPTSNHALIRAYIVMKSERFAYISDLIDYLSNNPIIAYLCSFSLHSLPKKDVFYRFIKNFSNELLKSVFATNVATMHTLGLVDFEKLLLDSTPMFANTHLNNSKVFFKDNSNQPSSDKDCKLGVHTASNDSNNKNFSFYWGYKNHILVDSKYSLPIFEFTTTANIHDVSFAKKIVPMADNLLHFKNYIKYLICDRGYDSNDFYEFMKDIFNAQVIAPLRSNSKAKLFDGNIPVCQAGLTMHRDGHCYRKSAIKFKFCCPFARKTSKVCPCNHKNFYKDTKSRGCIVWMHVPNANLRNSLNRDSKQFKSLYSKRTQIERYNSRFKQLSTERAYTRNINSISNLTTIAHIVMALTAIVSTKLELPNLIKNPVSLKRVA